MKFIALLLTVAVVISCNKPIKGKNGIAYKDAVAYNDYIVSRQTSLMEKVLAFGKVAETNLDSAASMLKKYVKDTEKMITEITGMPAFRGDSSLRDAAAASFTFYKRVFSQDYVDLLNIRQKEETTADDIAEMNKIVDRISKEEEGYDKRFHKAQRDFADKNKMQLRENEMQKEIDKM